MRSNNAGCLTALVSGGSRLLLLLYWISRPAIWNATFNNSWLLPCLGFIFLPFTTLVYVWLVQGPGATISGFDWLWLGLAVFIDIANTAGAAAANRNRMPGYTAPTTPPPAS